MAIYFNEVFKRLRKEKDLTQEQMAEILGVSPQAISRWETEATYPDITLLPAIAELFGTTVDDLLGTGKVKAQFKINEYLRRFTEALSHGCIYDCIDIMRSGVHEFPGNYFLLNKLMYALFVSGDNSGNIKDWEANQGKYYDEIIEIGERILNYCTDDVIRLDAKARLAFHYCDTNHKDKGYEIVQTLPARDSSRENMLYWALDGDDRLSYLQNEIDYSMNRLVWTIGCYTRQSNVCTQQKIRWTQKQIRVIEAVCENENYGDRFYLVAKIYGEQLAELYMDITDKENALRCLEKAAEYAIAYENLPRKFSETASLLSGLMRDKGNNESSDTRNICHIIQEGSLSRPCFDSIRKDPRFIAINDKLLMCTN